MKGYRIGNQFTKPKCTKSDSGLHEIQWNYKDVEFEDDCARIEGECLKCNLEFQKTYQQTEGLTVFAKSTRNVFNFNQEVMELN